jgi:crotonobetainyl-CoA:carnitine CoA-transferase CaiB-like acyl-CoA transferase
VWLLRSFGRRCWGLGCCDRSVDGVRVIDLSAVLSGPIATMLLAEQGADVIKVELPGVGDMTRVIGSRRGGTAALFANCNRSKRSIVVDLGEDRGRELVRELVQGADVFVQNFRPGVVERLGLGAEELLPDADRRLAEPDHQLPLNGRHSSRSSA